MRFLKLSKALVLAGAGATALSGCAGSGGGDRPSLPPAAFVGNREMPSEEYVIGPMDQLNIFVWRNPELSAKVQVRPDGRITTPLVNDMPAVGKTPAMLADDISWRCRPISRTRSSRSSSRARRAPTASRSASSVRPRSQHRSRIAPT